MQFVDSNILIYAVGSNDEWCRQSARQLADAIESGVNLCASAEVLQEVLYVFARRTRLDRYDLVLELVERLLCRMEPLLPADLAPSRRLLRNL